MQKTLLTLCLSVFSLLLLAQDTTFSKEVFAIFHPEKNWDELTELGTKGTWQFLKYRATPNPQNRDAYKHLEGEELALFYYLGSRDFIENSKTVLYKDSTLTEVFSREERNLIGKQVTIATVYDPETLEELEVPQIYYTQSNEIPFYKVKLRIDYNSKTLMFTATPLAIAPFCYTYNEGGDTTGQKAMFWAVVNVCKKDMLRSNAINWAKRVTYNCPLEEGNVTPEEEKQRMAAFKHFKNGVRARAQTIKLYSNMEPAGGDVLEPRNAEYFGISADTIYSAEPDVIEELGGQLPVVITEQNLGSLRHIRLAQDWYWDNRKQCLCMRYLGFAPIVERYDDNGNFLTRYPIFWLRK